MVCPEPGSWRMQQIARLGRETESSHTGLVLHRQEADPVMRAVGANEGFRQGLGFGVVMTGSDLNF